MLIPQPGMNALITKDQHSLWLEVPAFAGDARSARASLQAHHRANADRGIPRAAGRADGDEKAPEISRPQGLVQLKPGGDLLWHA